jgi:hypothetical protein
VKILVAKLPRLPIEVFGVLEPQPAGTVRAAQAADRVGMARIQHPDGRRGQILGARAVGDANYTSAQYAGEIGADCPAAQ